MKYSVVESSLLTIATPLGIPGCRPVNAGGDGIYTLNNRVGLRGDVRYSRAFVDESKREGAYFKDYGFVRAYFGVTLRFRGN
jgi:hypothetical protein